MKKKMKIKQIDLKPGRVSAISELRVDLDLRCELEDAFYRDIQTRFWTLMWQADTILLDTQIMKLK